MFPVGELPETKLQKIMFLYSLIFNRYYTHMQTKHAHIILYNHSTSVPPKKMNNSFNVVLIQNYSHTEKCTQEIQQNVINYCTWVMGIRLLSTTLSTFFYTLKFFTVKLEKNTRYTMFFPQVFPLWPSNPTTTSENSFFLKKSFLRFLPLLIIQTQNFPKGIISPLLQKMFMVSQRPIVPTSQHTQALHVYRRLGHQWCLLLSSLLSQGVEEKRREK